MRDQDRERVLLVWLETQWPAFQEWLEERHGWSMQVAEVTGVTAPGFALGETLLKVTIPVPAWPDLQRWADYHQVPVVGPGAIAGIGEACYTLGRLDTVEQAHDAALWEAADRWVDGAVARLARHRARPWWRRLLRLPPARGHDDAPVSTGDG